jgi:hypothetical protein
LPAPASWRRCRAAAISAGIEARRGLADTVQRLCQVADRRTRFPAAGSSAFRESKEGVDRALAPLAQVEHPDQACAQAVDRLGSSRLLQV